MEEQQGQFSIEMPKVGIIRGVLAKDIEVIGDRSVSLRTAARPFQNVFTVAQLRALRSVIEQYGSGKAHLTPRYNLELPEIGQKNVDTALRNLYCSGLFPGGAGTSVRNIYTCPDWCSQSIRPVQELGSRVSQNFGDQDMPNKVTISFAGCTNGCSRPQTCDIGIIAVGTIAISQKTCPDACDACIKSCRFKAIERCGDSVGVNEKCIGCTKCVRACGHGMLAIEKTGFRVLIGGKEGTTVRFGVPMAEQIDDFAVLGIVDRALGQYQANARLRPGSSRKKERLVEVIDRIGTEPFR